MAKVFRILPQIRFYKINRAFTTHSKMSLLEGTNGSLSPTTEENTGYSYKDAIMKLNSLQSNAQIRAQLAAQRGSRNLKSLPEMHLLLESIGITKSKLASLNMIHVAGTKGKGTTCAFTEFILRHAGLRTGFFSSPHLVVVRERIRIDGVPISKEKFAKYFFPVYNRLMSCKEKDPDFPLPPYFRFLTCMAFYAFLKEKVDVAIIEVGIGGRYDCTNVIQNPTVVGITSLGLEHQSILGNTLEEIAFNKAGIMKQDCPTFTVNKHPDYILKVLQDYAAEAKCSFSVVPNLSELSSSVQLGVGGGEVSKTNAALAVQLASSFLAQKFPNKLVNINTKDEKVHSSKVNFQLSPCHITGLRATNWPGRFQTIEVHENLKYFLDGAHTLDSLSIALKWFQKVSHDNAFRVVVFNVTGDRGSELLNPFAESTNFDLAIFCPVLRRNTSTDSDNWNILSQGVDLINACQKHCEAWTTKNRIAPGLTLDSTDAAADFISGLSNCSTKYDHLKLCRNINSRFNPKCFEQVQVLITGSLHLIGNVLSILEPSLND